MGCYNQRGVTIQRLRLLWYSWQHKTLSKTIARICEAACIKGYFTNLSLRTSAATRFFDAGVDEQLIMQRTGHRSVQGVRLYKRMTQKLKKKTSDVLNDCTNASPKKNQSGPSPKAVCTAPFPKLPETNYMPFPGD